jgi:hypothetical protein
LLTSLEMAKSLNYIFEILLNDLNQGV